MARWYRQGLAHVTYDSNIVTGEGTIWQTQVKVGDLFFLDQNRADFYEIAAINSDTEIELHNAFGGASQTSAGYAIIRQFNANLNADLAADMAFWINKTRQREYEMQAWLAGTVNGGPNSNGFYPITDLQGTQQLVPCPALILPPATPQQRVANGQFTKKLINPAGSAATINLAQAGVFYLNLDQPSCELSLINPVTSSEVAQHVVLVFEQGTGGNAVTWPSNIEWNYGMQPTLSTVLGFRDVFDLFTIDQGNSWFGFYSGVGIT